MKLTTDMLVGTLLCFALIIDIILGGPVEVATNLSAGLVGYLGRPVADRTAVPTEKKEPPASVAMPTAKEA